MGKRSYNQNCVLARAGDVIGERWTLLLIRDLLISPRRYGDLLESLKGIGTNLLAARLKELAAAGVLERRESDDGRHEYALTESGRALEPVLLALMRWSMIHGPANRSGDHHRSDWDLLALKALFQPDLAEGLSFGVQFRSEEFEGWVRIEDGEMHIGVGADTDADVVINGTIPDLFLGPASPADLLVSGRLASIDRFMSVFAR